MLYKNVTKKQSHKLDHKCEICERKTIANTHKKFYKKNISFDFDQRLNLNDNLKWCTSKKNHE